MKKYNRKPLTVFAIQYTGDNLEVINNHLSNVKRLDEELSWHVDNINCYGNHSDDVIRLNGGLFDEFGNIGDYVIIRPEKCALILERKKFEAQFEDCDDE